MTKLIRSLFNLFYLKQTYYILKENPIRLVVYGVVSVLFVVEVLLYYFNTFSWYSIKCENTEDCTRILLVADPQLIGLHNEPIKCLTPISKWDSDRYLAKTFSYAYQFTKPDVVIFLGDLFDEGSTATNYEFKSYYNRLINIFGATKDQHSFSESIWLPGDNDIGGESNDWITENKVKRFTHTFQQPDIINVKNVKFYKVNALTSSIPKVEYEPGELESLNHIIVGLSHIPLLRSRTNFVEEVLNTLKPHLLFTAHTHKLMIVRSGKDNYMEYLITPKQNRRNKVYQYDLGFSNGNVYEFTVPTCSYRMGTDQIGYGFAVTDSKSVRYTVLWSPSRFLQLIYYSITLVCVCIYLLCICKGRRLTLFSIRQWQQKM